jgi:copper transport protein
VGLSIGLLRSDTPADDVAAGLARFSRFAFAAVVVLVVSGIVQTVREVASPTALTSTSYGRILMLKIAFVLVALGAAGVSRVWVQQRLGIRPSRPGGRRSLTAHAFAASSQTEPAAEAPEEQAAGARRRVQSENAAEHLPALRRSVGVELLMAVVVLAMSSILVATPPARSAVAQPVDVTLPLQGSAGTDGSVQISVDPARPGPNVLHVYLFDDEGQLTQPAGIEVTLTEPEQQLGPIDVDLEPAGPGHYVGDGMAIPGAGTWTLAVSVRVDEFTATTARSTFPVR